MVWFCFPLSLLRFGRTTDGRIVFFVGDANADVQEVGDATLHPLLVVVGVSFRLLLLVVAFEAEAIPTPHICSSMPVVPAYNDVRGEKGASTTTTTTTSTSTTTSLGLNRATPPPPPHNPPTSKCFFWPAKAAHEQQVNTRCLVRFSFFRFGNL